MDGLLMLILRFVMNYGGDILSFFYLLNHGSEVWLFLLNDKIPADLLKCFLVILLVSTSFFLFSALATKCFGIQNIASNLTETAKNFKCETFDFSNLISNFKIYMYQPRRADEPMP